MMRNLFPLLTLIAAAGCSLGAGANLSMDLIDTAVDEYDSGLIEEPDLWIRVLPPSVGEQGEILFPERFGPFSRSETIDIQLLVAFPATGTITAERYLQWPSDTVSFAPAPTQEVEVNGRIYLVNTLTGRSFTGTVVEGEFSITAPPAWYEVYIFPDSATVPVYKGLLPHLQEEPHTIEIEPGTPIYGQVLSSDGTPLPDVEVQLTPWEGSWSESISTDEQGRYLMYADGVTSVSLRTKSDPTLRLPSLQSNTAGLDAGGLEMDFQYSSQTTTTLEVTVLDEDGSPLRGVNVRLSSDEVSGYDETEITPGYDVDGVTDSRGSFIARVPSGFYHLSAFPEADIMLSTYTISDFDLRTPSVSRTLTLTDYETLITQVVLGPDEIPLANATLSCQETEGQGRSYREIANDEGIIAIALPLTPSRCLISPPGQYPELTPTVFRTSEGNFPDVVTLNAGNKVVGSVTALDMRTEITTSVPYAIVELNDDNERELNATASSSVGEFSLTVPLPPQPR